MSKLLYRKSREVGSTPLSNIVVVERKYHLSVNRRLAMTALTDKPVSSPCIC